MLQAAIGDGHAFDALALGKNGFAAPEIDISRCQVLQAFVGAGVVVWLAGKMRPCLISSSSSSGVLSAIATATLWPSLEPEA
jgi:hypothetical protein